jgi:uncharacterized repeat protein (TIGR01451 family)
LFGGDGGSGGAATATFSSIEIRAIRDTSAIILWHTEILSGEIPMPLTGQVEYGLDTNYGNLTEIKDLSYFHSIRLTGLTPGTTYHFRLRAKDSEGNETISDDYTFTTTSEAIVPFITGISPNPTGDTIIDEDTVWESQNIQLAGNVIIGNTSKKVSLSIINSTITLNGYSSSILMGGPGTPGNLLIDNSTIFFNVTTGTETSLPPGVKNGQKIYVKFTYALDEACTLKIINSTVRGKDYQHLASGIVFESGWAGAFHTLILENSTLAFMGGMSTAGAESFALNTRKSNNDACKVASDSIINNVILDNCGWGMKLGKNGVAADYITTYNGYCLFFYGSSWNHLTMHNGTEGLYNPADGAWIRNSWFDANWTKFNIMGANDVIFENSTVLRAGFNAGDGGLNDGNNNTIRNCTFQSTGVGSLRTYLHVYNNTFSGQMGDTTIRFWGSNFDVWNNTLSGGTHLLNLLPHPDSGKDAGNHLVYNNVLDGASTTGIRISNEYNNTFINNIITNITSGCGISLLNSTTQIFRDTHISNSGLYDIYFRGGNANDNVFINTHFDESKVHFSDSSDIFKNGYYVDIKIEDLDGSPVQDAAVTITNDIDTNYPSININGEDKSSFTTGTDGHTPLPVGNETDSIAILDYWQNSTTTTGMTYTITAEKDGYIETVTGINPDETWYREDPNTYWNTITIVLPTGTPLIPALTLQKTVNKSSAQEGETLTYTITYQNTGSAQATNIVITDNIPTTPTYIDNSATGNYTYDNENKILTWTIDSLESGANGSVSFQVMINNEGIGMNGLDKKYALLFSMILLSACYYGRMEER